jgi:hypothetical protein
MARPQRIAYEGAVYHVTARGNERRAIFRDDADHECFLRVLGESVTQFVIPGTPYLIRGPVLDVGIPGTEFREHHTKFGHDG